MQALQKTVETETKINKELNEKLKNIMSSTGPLIQSMRASTLFATGNEISFIHANKNLKIPTFANESYDKPLKYLNELKEYINANSNSDIRCIMNNSPKKSASDWWHVVQPDVENFDDFKTKFKESFWSETIQEEYGRKLQFGKYRTESKQTCVQYATHMAAFARDLNYSEKDLVTKISRHFGSDIKNLIRSRTN